MKNKGNGKKMRNNLDERQEQALLKIEHNGCWFAFWALLAAIFAQQFIFGFDFRYMGGEWIIFMALALYMFAACMKNGIWDRHLKPDGRTNVLVSLIAAMLAGVLFGLIIGHRFPDSVKVGVLAGVFTAVIVFVVCIIVLTASVAALRRRTAEMEKEPEE